MEKFIDEEEYKDIDEKIKEYAENNSANKQVEDDTIKNLSKFFKNSLTYDEVKERLRKSKFGGIYLLDDEEYEKIVEDKCKTGIYNVDEKVILSSKSNVNRSNDVLIHEMVHALIDNKLAFYTEKVCNSLGGKIGQGFEEGIASTISSAYRYKNSEFTSNSSSYPYQVALVQQINVLYNYYSKKKYSSFLLHVTKEPKNTLHLLFDIYDDIIEQKVKDKINIDKINNKDIDNIAYKTANDMIIACDSMLDAETEDKKNLFVLASRLNYHYLLMCNEDIELKNYPSKELEVFPKIAYADSVISTEDKLLSLIFENNTQIYESILIELYYFAGSVIPSYYENNVDSYVKCKM